MDLALKYQNSANMKFLENNFRYSIEPIWRCHGIPVSRQVYPTKIWQICMLGFNARACETTFQWF